MIRPTEPAPFELAALAWFVLGVASFLVLLFEIRAWSASRERSSHDALD